MRKTLRLVCGVAALLVVGTASASKEWVLGSTLPAGVSVAGYANTTGFGTPANQTIGSANSITCRRRMGNQERRFLHDVRLRRRLSGGCIARTLNRQRGSLRHDVTVVRWWPGRAGPGEDGVELERLRHHCDGIYRRSPFNLATNLIGKTYMELTSSGWKAIGNYYNVETAITNVNSSHQTSSYWLIGAYNPLAYFGAAELVRRVVRQ